MNDVQAYESMLEFFRLEPSDLEILARLREALERGADRFVDEFYHHLLRFPETQNLLRERSVRDRLLVQQRAYLLSLTQPVIDDAYIQSRIRIGVAHERIGLETRWYLGAYALYFNLLIPLIRDAVGPDPVSVERAEAAMAKRLIFDAQIAIQQYTDRRERDLKRLNQELQAASRSLTREVAETTRDLRRTRARAFAAEQLASVATLVTGLAHEVGTPMGVIRGHAEALEEAVQSDRARWRLSMILEQIDRITSIIQSLLNIARPKQMLRVPLDLAERLDSSIGFLSEKLRRRAIKVRKRYEPVPTTVGDPEKLQQIFLNLFLNAIDAMPGGGTLGISLRPVDSKWVEITVTDTGTGISAEEIETIFEPFYTTKAAGHGNGLGLVVVQGIVSEHGGRIEARSEPGKGTEFEIRLPVNPSGADVELDPEAAEVS